MEERHDYIIIGAGTSGITLGYLLDKYDYDVVVLEAGEDKDNDPNISTIKSFYNLEDTFHNEYFWLENGKPNPRLPMDHNHFSGGRLWGGSSSINESIYWRGAQMTYDKWGGLFADSDFCNDAFCKLETFHGESQNPHLRGDKGPFSVVLSPSFPIAEKYIEGLSQVLENEYSLKIPIVEDIQSHNGPALSKRGQFFLDHKTHKRVSSSNALLKQRNSRLKIKSQATASKILFEGNKAVGVEYIHHGQTKKIYADKKVICCAGPRSPTILQHSGIGDAELLRDLDIPVVKNNKEVGKNLTNHLLVIVPMDVPFEDNEEIAKSIYYKGFSNFCALPDVGRGDLSDIDIEIACLSREPGKTMLASILVNPSSRGYVSICSNDPLHPIVVDTNYLAEHEDIEKIQRALQVQEKVALYLEEKYEGYKLTTDLSNKLEYIKNNTVHIHHWTGTCQIGKVIDEHLNVMGIENLMVADTSSIPEITRGHTYAPALLIGVAAFIEITQNKDWDF